MSEPGFWDNKDKAQADVEKVSRLRGLIEPYRELETRTADLSLLHEMAREEAAKVRHLSKQPQHANGCTLCAPRAEHRQDGARSCL